MTELSHEIVAGESKLGKLYGVSLGPGDPGLITRRAWQLLQGSAHWTYPVRAAGSDSYALDIVRRAGLLPTAATPLIFPMTPDAERLARAWLIAAQTVLDRLRLGHDVAFLVEGDASTYATFGHLARTVRALDATIAIDVIAGVPSHHAAAARLGKPLVEQEQTLAILPANYSVATVLRLLPEFDTLVLLKVKPLLDELITALEANELADEAAFLERIGTPDERIVRGVSQLKGTPVHYLSLLIVRNATRSTGRAMAATP